MYIFFNWSFMCFSTIYSKRRSVIWKPLLDYRFYVSANQGCVATFCLRFFMLRLLCFLSSVFCSVLWPCCAYVQVGFRHSNHLLRVRKRLGEVFLCLPQTWLQNPDFFSKTQEVQGHLLVIIRHSLHLHLGEYKQQQSGSIWFCPGVSLKISSGTTLTNVEMQSVCLCFFFFLFVLGYTLFDVLLYNSMSNLCSSFVQITMKDKTSVCLQVHE